ncbi:copper resistance protein CopC [Paenibacillus sp. Soil787]|uniref:copper resistance protein CopC n=1 Tax=Paenibacillus sp. Soil787 TaxID=1736411 RepID=UPI000703507F|nr:copper resistance protein CopC [Paenibacillus sp. Soil787]KRF18628.1 hypothetical protein ASG93_11350 [Paenibacillus sp. Soil787]
MFKKWLFAFVLVLCFLTSTTTAFAHTAITKRFPQADASLETPPKTVDVYFLDQVDVHSNSIIVRNEQKIEVQEGKAKIDPNDITHVSVNLKQNLSPGKYDITIDVVALDGHPVREEYQFEIKKSPEEEMFERLKLDRTVPEDGSILPTSPKKIELWYTEPAKLSVFALLDDKQQMLSIKNPIVDPNDPKHYFLDLDTELSEGTYAIHSLVQIGDKQKYEIKYFAVKKFSSFTGTAATTNDSLFNHIGFLQISRWLAFISLLTLFGITIFQQFVDKGKGNQQPRKQYSKYFFGISILTLLLELVLNKFRYSEIILKDYVVFNFFWIPVLQTLFVGISWIFKGKLRIIFLFPSVLCFALTGHSIVPGYGGGWGVVITLIHLLGVAYWIGGLLAFLIWTPQENSTIWLRETGTRFSKGAVVSVILIGVSGIWMVIKYVPSFSFDSLISSYWGQMLFVKTFLYVCLVFIGYWQRKFLFKMAQSIATQFLKFVKVELVLLAIILFATGVLVDLSPKEAERGIYPKNQVQQGIEVKMDITPLKAGANDVVLQFNNATEFQKVSVKYFASTDYVNENTAFSLGNGLYKITGNVFHGAGTTNVVVEALKANGEKLEFPFKIQVPGVMPTNNS